MVAKKIVVGLSCAVILSAGVLVALLGQAKIVPNEHKTGVVKAQPKQPVRVQPQVVERKYDLYSTVPYDLPLISILEISDLSENVKTVVDELLEQAGGCFLLKNVENNKTVLILQNSILNENVYLRHDIDIVEVVRNSDGSAIKTVVPLGYKGYDGETVNAVSSDSKRDDYWKFDKSTEPYRPLKHIIYDENGKTKYVENWDYSTKNPIKYVMKDSKGNVISIFKETLEDDVNLRQEHIFYDEEGNIAISLNVNYDGANITRFTYYNSYDSALSGTVVTEYSDGLKTKETVYNNAYELVNTVVAEYLENDRKSIKLFDINEKQLKKISS